MSHADQQTQDSLCGLCQQFVTDLINSNFCHSENYSFDKRWKLRPLWYYGETYSFPYHNNAEELSANAQSCSLCRTILEVFEPEDHSLISNLGLFVIERQRGPIQIMTLSFDSGLDGPYRDPLMRLFDFAAYEPRDHGDLLGTRFLRPIPENPTSQEALDTARAWMTNCIENHSDCSAHVGRLPTRVIDLGAGPGDSVTIYTTKGASGRYAALSHCWGGGIPGKTTTKTLEEYQQSLPINGLPQNFCDAILVTRELGLRYLWIDAMCILQDSYEDWRREAAKMTAIYSNATVTISALDSPGSTTGFLQPRPKDGVIGRGFVIKRNRDNLDYGTNRSILSTRGWCLQERMLSPSLLHFSREQMYWECRTGVNQEIMKDEPIVYRSNFTLVRKVFGMGTSLTFRDWYHTVEEYSRRKLSYGSDKLPALAGIADRFRSVGIGGEYVAGLWAHDIERGIFWVTNWDPVERPTHARAPSWSWASLDGQVEFQLKGDFQHRHETDLSLSLSKVLQISIGVGMDDPAAPEVQGCLKIRGPVAQMRYQHNDPSDLHGSLAFENEEPIALRAVMDFDRNVSRDCWVLTAGPSDPRILLLEEIDVGTFRRIGCVKWYQDSPNRLELSAEEFSRFLVRDMVLV